MRMDAEDQTTMQVRECLCQRGRLRDRKIDRERQRKKERSYVLTTQKTNEKESRYMYAQSTGERYHEDGRRRLNQ